MGTTVYYVCSGDRICSRVIQIRYYKFYFGEIPLNSNLQAI